MNHLYTIEDCLEMLVGHTVVPGLSWKDKPFKLHLENRKVLFSIGTQVFKGKALTEKQHYLVKKLLVEWYAEQFSKVNIDISQHVDVLRSAYRVVDKSHWVKKTEDNGNTYISIRFPFNNSAIEHINQLKMHQTKENLSKDEYQYSEHTHSFKYNENNILKIVDIANKFEKESFEFDEEVINDYNTIKEFETNKDAYIPGVYNFEYKNIPKSLEQHLTSEYGKPTEHNLLELWDKRRLYGLHHFDKIDRSLCSTLTNNFLDRQYASMHVRSDVWTLSQVFEALFHLKRFPLLILIDETEALDQLSMLWNTINGMINNVDVSVTFRLDNKNNNEFNQFIRSKGLNNSVTTKTKIVIASRKKISKPILKSEWNPMAMLTLGQSRLSGAVMHTVLDNIDFKVFYTKEDSMISMHRRRREDKYKLGLEVI